MSEQAPDVAAWLAHPITVEWVKWLNEKADYYRRHLPGYVARQELEKARTAAGCINAYEEILRNFEPEIVQEKEPEMPYIDPATRLSLRQKHDS